MDSSKSHTLESVGLLWCLTTKLFSLLSRTRVEIATSSISQPNGRGEHITILGRITHNGLFHVSFLYWFSLLKYWLVIISAPSQGYLRWDWGRSHFRVERSLWGSCWGLFHLGQSSKGILSHTFIGSSLLKHLKWPQSTGGHCFWQTGFSSGNWDWFQVKLKFQRKLLPQIFDTFYRPINRQELSAAFTFNNDKSSSRERKRIEAVR